MFLKKSSEFNASLVNEFAALLKKAEESSDAPDQTSDECKKDSSAPECKDIDKLQKVVTLLSDACAILEEDEKYKKVCKKIVKAIKILEKVSKVEAKEITPSEEVEKEVQ